MKRGNSFPPYSNEANGWTTGDEAPSSGPGQHVGHSTPDGVLETSPSSKSIPGRPRRRHPSLSTTFPAPKKKKQKTSFWRRFHSRWIKGYSPLLLAVMLWYLLGVVSIGTSKLLLMKPTHHVGNIPPLYLTLQQLFLGSNFLRFLLGVRAFGSQGVQPFPSHAVAATSHRARRHKASFWKSHRTDLIMAGLYFAMGFLATNYSFQQSSAAFVETIKAAEPITSAAVAVMWGIETLGPPEVSSLAGIVAGVLLSTWGNAGESTESTLSVMESVQSCCVVMAANLCFSFRGLHQKLFRASSHGSASEVDDLNLQFRMQQIGVSALLVPVVIWNGPGMISSVWKVSQTTGLIQSGVLLRYLTLSLVNGLAFTSYNLASTFVLTRISVVHHAALNCIRRIFAIVVTSIMFGIPITWTGAFGIAVSFGGFLSFTHYKAKRLRQPKPLSSLLPMSAV